MKNFTKQHLSNPKTFKHQLWSWARQHKVFIWLDANNHSDKYNEFDYLLAVDIQSSIKTSYHNAFEQLKDFQNKTEDWIFGYLGYDLKNDTEDLNSSNDDDVLFPDLFFFQPKKIFLVKDNQLFIKYQKEIVKDIDSDIETIENLVLKEDKNHSEKLEIQSKVSKADYLDKVNQLLHHIQRGDIYEINFCMEFFANNADIKPYEIYQKLNKVSQPPFASFLKINDLYALSASPERYLKKKAQKVISQPIKGTAKRSAQIEKDEALKQSLLKDPKEQSENVMIVDLVRHDLSKTALKNSVKVEELFGLHSFLQVHQMISTISSEVSKNIPVIEIIKTTFPMGSMTGAPKIKAMQLIETFEATKRGLYSGALGYITPDGDFDFSVMIRSILYNQEKKYVSYSVGSAITAKSKPEKEYEECLLKAKALKEVLTDSELN